MGLVCDDLINQPHFKSNVFLKLPCCIFYQGLHKPFVCNVKRDVTTETRKAVTPRHDVNSPGALVMPRPNASHQVTAVPTSEFAVMKSFGFLFQLAKLTLSSVGNYHRYFRI